MKQKFKVSTPCSGKRTIGSKLLYACIMVFGFTLFTACDSDEESIETDNIIDVDDNDLNVDDTISTTIIDSTTIENDIIEIDEPDYVEDEDELEVSQ